MDDCIYTQKTYFVCGSAFHFLTFKFYTCKTEVSHLSMSYFLVQLLDIKTGLIVITK